MKYILLATLVISSQTFTMESNKPQLSLLQLLQSFDQSLRDKNLNDQTSLKDCFFACKEFYEARLSPKNSADTSFRAMLQLWNRDYPLYRGRIGTFLVAQKARTHMHIAKDTQNNSNPYLSAAIQIKVMIKEIHRMNRETQSNL